MPAIAYHAADLLVRSLPPGAARAFGRTLARAAFTLPLPARREAERNFRRLDPAAPAAAARMRARESYEHFALSIVDFLRLARLDAGAVAGAVTVRGAEHLESAERSGRGVILLSAHLGNWEWGAAWLALRGTRVRLVARPHSSGAVETFFSRRRARWGVESLGVGALWGRATAALRAGAWVALMADRTPPGAPSVCAWAAALSRRTGALVLPGVVLRLPDGRYAACFDPPLRAADVQAGEWRRRLRGWIERHPGQWCAFEPLAEGLV